MIGSTANRAGTLASLFLLLSGCSPAPDAGVGNDTVANIESAPATTVASKAPISLDELYTLPRLIGTSPENYVWSATSSHLAFLWNDAGLAFRDVWICEREACTPRRMTHHGEAAARDSLHGGISEAVWRQPAERGLIYVLDGRLYAIPSVGQSKAFEPDREHVRNVKVSPEGNSLSFVSGGPVDSRQFEFHPGGGLWVRDADPEGAAAVELVPGGHDAQFVESYQWSADGRSVAFVMADLQGVPKRQVPYQLGGENRILEVRRAFPGDETTRRQIGVVNVESGEIQWLEREDELRPIWGYGLSSDGKRMFVNESDFLIKEHVVEIFDFDSGARERFYQHPESANVIPGWQVAWAPGDEGLIILTDRDGYYQLYHQQKSNGPLTPITAGEWEIDSFEIDATKHQIYFIANEAHPAERQIYRVSISGGELERLSQQAGTHVPVFSPDFQSAAVRFSNDYSPPDLYLNSLDSKTEALRITVSQPDRFKEFDWAEVTYPTFKSHVDGTRLTGRLLLPPDFNPSRRYPMIVGSIYPNTVRNNWGGGSATPIWGLDQHLVSRGYVVFAVDVRGSWGHGKAFSQGLLGDYGGIDTDDIESGVRHIIEQGFVDPDRIGIWGWSYGGLMTLMSLSKKPGLYAVGIADAPATNVWHAFPEQMWVMGEREGDDYPARYERLSALYHTDTIEAPLMILHGTADAVVMYADSIAFIEKLMAREVLYEFVPMPGTSHVWAEGNLARQRYGYKKIAEFFDRHLQP